MLTQLGISCNIVVMTSTSIIELSIAPGRTIGDTVKQVLIESINMGSRFDALVATGTSAWRGEMVNTVASNCGVEWDTAVALLASAIASAKWGDTEGLLGAEALRGTGLTVGSVLLGLVVIHLVSDDFSPGHSTYIDLLQSATSTYDIRSLENLALEIEDSELISGDAK